MKSILWLATSSMQLQPIQESLEYAMRLLFTSVSSMNLQPIVAGLQKEINSGYLCRFDKGKEEQHHFEGEVDQEILAAFDKYKPDVVIYSGPAEGKCRPFLSTFHTMRKSAKVMNLVCDGGCPNWHPLLELYQKEGCFDLTVNIDGNDEWPRGPRDLTMWGPIDPRFYEKKIPKSIEFGFAGGCGSTQRRELIQRLKESSGLVVPERQETWGTYQGYADFMLSCKAVFNTGKTGSGLTHHMKYRIIESGLAKCCVLEEVNPVTRRWFTPNVDYFEYGKIEDVEDFINEKKDSTPFAENLHKKLITEYTTEKFWKRVFDALDVIVFT